MQICVQARLGTCWLWVGCFFMCSSSMQRKSHMQICMQAGWARRSENMLVAVWHFSAATVSFQFSFSGVCVCGLYGTVVARKFAGAMPSWDWMHEVDWQMLGGVCAGNSGEVLLPLVIAQVIRRDVSLETRVIGPRRHGTHRHRKC